MTFKSQHFDSEFLASMWLIFYGLLPSHPLLFIFFNQDLFILWRPPVVKDDGISSENEYTALVVRQTEQKV